MSDDGQKTLSNAASEIAKPYEKPTLTKGPVLTNVVAQTKGSLAGSDARLKRHIRPLEELPNGLTLYRFRYLGSDVEMVGVLAQEVLNVVPEAVLLGTDGFYRVDYEKLGLRCTSFSEWLAERPHADAA